MATTNVSCEADREFVENLGLLAKKHRTTIGKLVRGAIDQVHGSELADVKARAAIFFADDCASEFNTALESTEA